MCFSRGWTLQELVAPRKPRFVDKNWTGILGDEESLGKVPAEISGVGRQADGWSGFDSRSQLSSFSVAQRVSGGVPTSRGPSLLSDGSIR